MSSSDKGTQKWGAIWRFLRLDDLYAFVAVLFFLILSIWTSASLFSNEVRNFLILLLYYFVLGGLAAGASRLRILGKFGSRLLLSAILCLLFVFLVLLPDGPPGIAQFKNFIVLSFPVLVMVLLPPEPGEGAFMGRGLRIARDWGPYVFSIALYLALHDVVHQINPTDRDLDLIALDERLFGGHASVWLEAYARPWLTEWLSVNYSLYVFFPLTLGIVLTLRQDRPNFLLLLQAAILTSYLGYVGYLWVPAIGPIHTLAHLYQAPIDGGALFEANRQLMDGLRIPRDCFPSLHTAHTLVVLLVAFKHRWWLGALYLPFGASCILATLYLRYHYLSDVLAGALLALFTVIITPHLSRLWDSLRSQNS